MSAYLLVSEEEIKLFVSLQFSSLSLALASMQMYAEQINPLHSLHCRVSRLHVPHTAGASQSSFSSHS